MKALLHPWENASRSYGNSALFFLPFFSFSAHDKAMKYDIDEQNMPLIQTVSIQNKVYMQNRSDGKDIYSWPSQLLVRCEVRVSFLSRHTVCK